jgi:hypothetical protein
VHSSLGTSETWYKPPHRQGKSYRQKFNCSAERLMIVHYARADCRRCAKVPKKTCGSTM